MPTREQPPALIGDVVLLPQRPGFVRWACDGRIAVLTEEIVFIYTYSPSHAHAVAPDEDSIMQSVLTHIINNEKNSDEFRWFRSIVSELRDHSLISGVDIIDSAESITQPYLQKLQWSPLGFAWDGGCLIALLDSKHRLSLYQPPKIIEEPTWHQCCSLSHTLFRYFYARVAADGVCNNSKSDSSKKKKRKMQTAEDRKEQHFAATFSEGIVDINMKNVDPQVVVSLYHKIQIYSMAWCFRLVHSNYAVIAVGGCSQVSLWAIVGCRCKSIEPISVKPCPLAVFDVGSAEKGEEIVHSIEWSPGASQSPEDREILVAASSDGSMLLFNVNFIDSGNALVEPLLSLRNRGSQPVQNITSTSSHSFQYFAASSVDTATVYAVQKSRLKAVTSDPIPYFTWKAHDKIVSSLYTLESPSASLPTDEATFITSSLDGEVAEWRIMPGVFECSIQPKKKILYKNAEGIIGCSHSPCGIALCAEVIKPPLVSDEILTAHQVYYQSRTHAANLFFPLCSTIGHHWEENDWTLTIKSAAKSKAASLLDWIWVIRDKAEWGYMISAAGAVREVYLANSTQLCHQILNAAYEVFLSLDDEHLVTDYAATILRIIHIVLVALYRCLAVVDDFGDGSIFDHIKLIRRALMVILISKFHVSRSSTSPLSTEISSQIFYDCQKYPNCGRPLSENSDAGACVRIPVLDLIRSSWIGFLPTVNAFRMKVQTAIGRAELEAKDGLSESIVLSADLCTICRSQITKPESWVGGSVENGSLQPPLIRTCVNDHIQRICPRSFEPVDSLIKAGTASCPMCQTYCNFEGRRGAEVFWSGLCPFCWILLE